MVNQRIRVSDEFLDVLKKLDEDKDVAMKKLIKIMKKDVDSGVSLAQKHTVMDRDLKEMKDLNRRLEDEKNEIRRMKEKFEIEMRSVNLEIMRDAKINELTQEIENWKRKYSKFLDEEREKLGGM